VPLPDPDRPPPTPSPPPGPAGPAPAAWLARAYLTWLPALLVAAGAAVRLREYAFRRSLWLDEASVALNLVRRSYGALLAPLDLDQAAPVGWLWAERAAVDLLGPSEYALRLVPVLAGVAVLPAAWLAARRLLSPWLVPVAVALVAVAPFLRRYANEAKQYETDAAIGLGLLLVSLPLLEDRPGRRRLLAWSAAGAVAVWCSHPAVLLLCGYTAVLLARQLLRRDWAAVARVAAAALGWGASFLAAYAVALAPARDNPALQHWWREGFAPRPLAPATALPWLGRRAVGFVDDPLGLTVPLAVAAALALGAAALLRARPAQAALLLGPLPFFVGAAAVRAYPLLWRAVLVLVPTVLLVAAAAADWPGGRLGLAGRVAGAGLLAAILVAPAADTVRRVGRPITIEELRPVLEQVEANRRPGDRVWLYRGAGPAFDFYAPGLGLAADDRLERVAPARPCGDIRRSLRRAARGGGRVWVVFGHQHLPRSPRERAMLLSRLDLVGTRVDALRAPGAAAYLYDLAAGPSDPGGKRVVPIPPPRTCYLIRPAGP
jgi:hypothetical protein